MPFSLKPGINGLLFISLYCLKIAGLLNLAGDTFPSKVKRLQSISNNLSSQNKPTRTAKQSVTNKAFLTSPYTSLKRFSMKWLLLSGKQAPLNPGKSTELRFSPFSLPDSLSPVGVPATRAQLVSGCRRSSWCRICFRRSTTNLPNSSCDKGCFDIVFFLSWTPQYYFGYPNVSTWWYSKPWLHKR